MELDPAFHIQPGGGFVQKHNVRVADQGQGQVQPPLLPGGKLHILFFFQSINAQGRKHGGVGGGPVPFGEQAHGLHGADVGRKRGRLQLDAHPAVDRNAAPVAGAQALDAFKGGGLARAVDAQQREDFAFCDLEIKALQHGAAAVALAQALHLDGTIHFVPSPSGS